MSELRACYLTCAGRVDGIGAQVQATLSTILAARELHLTYCHTPFKEVEHYVDKESAAIEWENFFSLGKDEICIKDIRVGDLDVVHIETPTWDEILQFTNKSNTLFVVQHCHNFADHFPDRYLDMKDRILEKYMSSSKEEYTSYYKPDKINIAVHVRRGDVYKHRVNRYTDNQFYKDLLIDIVSILDSLQLDASIHLFSQGLPEDFGDLNELDLTFHLDECTYTTFYNLTSADILVMAKSSFSYATALFSNSIKIYQPFLHKPLKSWILADRKEKDTQVIFDIPQLKRMLELKLIQKEIMQRIKEVEVHEGMDGANQNSTKRTF
jgi:hypothetical protein